MIQVWHYDSDPSLNNTFEGNFCTDKKNFKSKVKVEDTLKGTLKRKKCVK
jgi:hypothetical protein